MFRWVRSLGGGSNPRAIDWPVAASQTITKGDLLVISSGKAALAAAGITAGTILGIAQHDKASIASPAATDVVSVLILTPLDVVNADWAGSTKTTLADADRGTIFDVTDEDNINLDDTTGGSFIYLSGTDNTAKTADFVVKASQLVLGQ